MNAEQQLYADTLQFVLDRLDAWAASDSTEVSRLDASAPQGDPVFLSGMFACAFAVALKTMDVLESVDAAEAERTRASFREQLEELRRS